VGLLILFLILTLVLLGNEIQKAQLNYKNKWSGRKDFPALSLPKETFDLLVPNQMPSVVERYGFLLILSECR
jgi:hypothetical protein